MRFRKSVGMHTGSRMLGVGTKAILLPVLASMLMLIIFLQYARADLPEGRVYEQVSPVEKDGYAAMRPGGHDPFAVALNGEASVFGSLGTFAGAQSDEGYNAYIARRTGSGWVTVPDSLATTSERVSTSAEDFSPNLEKSVALVKAAASFGRAPEAENAAFALYEPSGVFLELPSGGLKSVTVSPGAEETVSAGGARLSRDLSHLIFTETFGTLLPQDTMKNEAQLYGIAGLDSQSPQLELIGVDHEGKVIDPYCGVVPGSPSGTAFNAISADGSAVFFTTNVNPAEKENCATQPLTDPQEVFVRLNGHTTLEISKPPTSPECSEAQPCNGTNRTSAEFQGASEDGTRAFFTTTAALLPEDKNADNDLYMVEIDREVGHEGVSRLVMLSQDQHIGEAAEVQGIVRLSDDGRQVYFVARGALSSSNGEGRAPTVGADNLYRYDTVTGFTTFVADLCSGHELSGVLTGFTACPSTQSDESLWAPPDLHEAQVAGEVLVFASNGQLTSDDTDMAKDIYRYDAKEERLQRVSTGEQGVDSNGNDDAFGAQILAPEYGIGSVVTQDELRTRAVSDDGSKIVFTSSGPLSTRAINGKANVYEWHSGEVSLISSGTAAEADDQPVITPSGNDVFFDTIASLVPQDTDGVRDIYDARVDGGFATPTASPSGCYPESCGIGPYNPTPFALSPGSALQTPEGNASSNRIKQKTPSRAQLLARALRSCRKLAVKRRRVCESTARRRYGKAKATKTSRLRKSAKNMALGGSA